MRNLAVGFALGAGIGAGGCYFYLSSVGPLSLRNDASVTRIWPSADPVRITAAAEFGIPVTEAVRVYDGYVAAYDYRTRNSKWILEHLTPESLEGQANRNRSEFHEDAGIDPLFRARLDDFKDSGYDRGHLTPAADHKSSQKRMDETFSLVNVSPQVGKGFNRDYWERFERFVRGVAKKCDNVYVVTGPLWLAKPQSFSPSISLALAGDGGAVSRSDDFGGEKWVMQHAMIGKPPGLVSVPTHYYKVVLADGRSNKDKGGSRQVSVGAFVIPNAPVDNQIPLSAFTVPLEALEQVAGARFFPSFLNPTRLKALDKAAHEWRHYGMTQLKPFDRVCVGRDLAALPSPPATLLLTEGGNKSGGANSPLALASLTEQGQAAAVGGGPPAGPALPKTKGAGGTIHLCELNACKLPPPFSSPSSASEPRIKDGGRKGGGGGGGGPRGRR